MDIRRLIGFMAVALPSFAESLDGSKVRPLRALTVYAKLRKWHDKLNKSAWDKSLYHQSHFLNCGKWNSGG
jgi:hypothetical protein